MPLFLQSISLLGAVLILVAFAQLQRRRWSVEHITYLWCNLVGAVLLTAVAVADRRLGFIVLEGAWALLTLMTLVRAGPTTR